MIDLNAVPPCPKRAEVSVIALQCANSTSNHPPSHPQNLPPRLKRTEASAYLMQRHGISRTAGTLAKLACKGGGPAFRKVGAKVVVYDVEELDRWAAEIIGEPRRSTSEAA